MDHLQVVTSATQGKQALRIASSNAILLAASFHGAECKQGIVLSSFWVDIDRAPGELRGGTGEGL